MASSESQPELKRRARRRLVGAVALALLAAVVLPMVMDHEPRQSAQDIQIRIPGQDQGPIAHPTPPPEDGDKPAAAAESSAPPQAAVREAPPKRPPEPAPEIKPRATEASAKVPAPPAAAAATARSEPPAKPEAATPPKPETAAAKPATDEKASQREAERVRAVLEAQPAAHYYLQLGVFSDAANARNILAKSQAQGVAAKGEALDVKGTKSTRVRAGPFATREEAERARQKLKQAGVDGKLMETP
ncbi:MAG: SPOR domain-containing protein [Rhodocyclaceae bacterium]|nr:SPOR domain-containing protein [Rhodocyclaceae bacterium]